jgi:hypothetical protein
MYFTYLRSSHPQTFRMKLCLCVFSHYRRKENFTKQARVRLVVQRLKLCEAPSKSVVLLAENSGA